MSDQTQQDNVEPESTEPAAPEVEKETAPETGNSEAARRRHQLREVEAERDRLRDQLQSQQRALIEWRAANHPDGAVDPDLLTAAGLNFTNLADTHYVDAEDNVCPIIGEDGNLSIDAFDAFANGVARKFNVKRNQVGPTPNPQQGSPSAGGGSPASWTQVIKGK